MWGTRLVLFGLGIALGVALIARGSVLIGGIVLAMALTRIVIFLQWRKRRQELRRRFPRSRL